MKTTAPIRLQKFLAQCGVASRRKAEELIATGAVTVNGRRVTELGGRVIPNKDKVCLRGKLLRPERPHVYIFYKPAGVLTAMGDASRRKTIIDYVKHLPVRVFPVGRLDYDVTGLIILTNDGALAERLLHPRYGVPRVYWAVVSGKPRRAMLTKLKQGVAIAGKLVQVEQVSVLGPSKRAMRLFGPQPKGTALIQVMVSRGEKHMVKNILAAVGLPVVQLCRVAFGEYRLGSLKPGEVREV